ncbi:MAG TPA: cysteine--tRNA ligase [Ktedonobacterales bacterium]|jgi:cysteinyl-tRNA synthetase
MLIHNTESGREEVFEPYALPVKMYVCGLTPKNEPHIGHARNFVLNDVIRRYLEYRGYPVRYIQNFTDVDDKIIAAGQREGIPAAEAAKRYIDRYFAAIDPLNVRRADQYTYVTQYMPKIIAMIQTLVDKGHAYASGGDVFYAVSSFPRYGRLSHQPDEDLLNAGARIEPDPKKRDPRDFALWKAAKPGEPFWESPWGHGRPGWHIECSTMALDTLGEKIDIHGGGTDLIFPHHENEIAQSEAATDTAPFAKYWVHVGMLNLGDKKMAHSDVFIPLIDMLKKYPAPVIRLYLVSHHYRAPIAYSEEALAAVQPRWARYVELRNNLLRLLRRASEGGSGNTASAAPIASAVPVEETRAAFIAAMDDDFNTSGGLAAIDNFVRRANDYAAVLEGTEITPEAAATLQAALDLLDELIMQVLGVQIEQEDAAQKLDPALLAEIERLIAERNAARQAKQWGEADRIRKELEARHNVILKDRAQETTWEFKA